MQLGSSRGSRSNFFGFSMRADTCPLATSNNAEKLPCKYVVKSSQESSLWNSAMHLLLNCQGQSCTSRSTDSHNGGLRIDKEKSQRIKVKLGKTGFTQLETN